MAEVLSAREKARLLIAATADWWVEGRGEPDDPPHMLGEHNADRIIDALDRAGIIFARKE